MARIRIKLNADLGHSIPIKESFLPLMFQLELAVQELISLICDIKTMEQSVVEMEYDTKKAPLGKITTEQVIFIQIGRSLTV
jgi:hypothetical protein